MPRASFSFMYRAYGASQIANCEFFLFVCFFFNEIQCLKHAIFFLYSLLGWVMNRDLKMGTKIIFGYWIVIHLLKTTTLPFTSTNSILWNLLPAPRFIPFSATSLWVPLTDPDHKHSSGILLPVSWPDHLDTLKFPMMPATVVTFYLYFNKLSLPADQSTKLSHWRPGSDGTHL